MPLVNGIDSTETEIPSKPPENVGSDIENPYRKSHFFHTTFSPVFLFQIQNSHFFNIISDNFVSIEVNFNSSYFL